jgi:hypothetical protein
MLPLLEPSLSARQCQDNGDTGDTLEWQCRAIFSSVIRHYELQTRSVELWLHSLDRAPKSKAHIRGLLSVLWNIAVWRGDMPMLRNPHGTRHDPRIKQAQDATKELHGGGISEIHSPLGVTVSVYGPALLLSRPAHQ